MRINKPKNIWHFLSWLLFIMVASTIAFARNYKEMVHSIAATYIVIVLMFLAWKYGEIHIDRIKIKEKVKAVIEDANGNKVFEVIDEVLK